MARHNIVLTGHGGSLNRGCQAILQCSIDLIRQYIPGAKVTVLSKDPGADRAAMGTFLRDEAIAERRPAWPRRYTRQWARNVIKRRLLGGSTPYRFFLNRQIYRKADVVVSIGGDNFTDSYGSPAIFFKELAFARACGARTVIWAASIGPFRDPEDEARWTDELRVVDLITVREDSTLQYLKRLGVIRNVFRVADPAFLLPAQANGLLGAGLVPGRTLVGISMSALIGAYGVSEERYFEAFVGFARRLLKEESCSLILVPHVTMDGANGDDHAVCVRLAGELAAHDKVFVLDRRADAREMKGAIGRCDFFVGARTHSTIASLSCCVPTLSISYSSKAYGLNQQVFGHHRYVLDIKDVGEDTLMRGYRLLREEGGQITSHLVRVIPGLREMAHAGGAQLAALCGMID